MTTPPTPQLAISQTTTFLDNVTLGEQFPIGRITYLIKSQQLPTLWDDKNYAHKYAKRHHDNVVKQLEEYMKNFNSKHKFFNVRYTRGKSKFGRAMVQKSLGLTSFSKRIRNALIKNLYYDFDISNAQPDIIVKLCKKHNIPHDVIQRYVDDRENILRQICEIYGVKRNNAKKLMLRLCFFGSVKEWKKENGIESSSDYSFLEQFRNQLNQIASEVKTHNMDLYNTCRHKKEAKGDKNFIGSFFSTYLQEHEFQIVSKVMEWIVKETNYATIQGCKTPVATYEFDGIKLLKRLIDNGVGASKFTKLLNEKTKELTGFELNWEVKEIEEAYDIPESADEEVVEEQANGVLNDLEATEKLLSLYPHWKYCGEELYVFNHETGMWSTDKVVQDKIIIEHTPHLYVATIDKDGNRIVSTTKSYGNTETLRNRMYSSIRSLTQDENWLNEKQSSSLGRLLFNNGYFDGHEGLFYSKEEYQFNPEIVFFARIPHDFETLSDDDVEYMNSVETRLFHNPLGKEQGDYLKLNLARGLMGDCMKRLLMGLGVSNSGKSVLAAAISKACGKYVGTFNGENLAHTSTGDDEAKALRWALDLRHTRLIFSNEMSTKVPLNGNMLKKISSGGDTLIGRHHCKKETEFIPQFLPICFANDVPKIEPYDDAVDTRLRFVSFRKTFVENPTNEFELQMDPAINDELKTLRFQRVLVALLVKTYMELKDNGIPPEPLEVVKAKEEWAGEEKDPLACVFNEFEITNDENDFVESETIHHFLKHNKIDMSMKKFGTLLTKHCVLQKLNNVRNGAKKINKKTKQVWFGLKEILEIPDETDDAVGKCNIMKP